MSRDKIIVTIAVYDNADILTECIEWYLGLGVDLVLAQDCGSTDGSQDILEGFARTEQVRWFLLPERNMLKYRPGDAVAAMARDQYAADWIVICDPDEFLTLQGDDLRTILRTATRDDVSVISVPRLNMTGPPLEPGDNGLRTLRLRIDRPVVDSEERRISGNLSVPHVFVSLPPRALVRASTFLEYGPGAHDAATAGGRRGSVSGLRFLHYAVRGFDELETKVRHTVEWFADNTHLEPQWGWHWRRWIRLREQGRLRDDYDRQFVSPARAEELVRDGICSIDDTVARWISARR